MNASEVSKGMMVGFARFGNHGLSAHGFGVVSKVTKTKVVVDPIERTHGGVGYHYLTTAPKEFNKYGNEAGREYGGFSLMPVDDLEMRLATEKARRERNQAATEVIRRVTEILNAHRNSYGDFFPISAEEKEELVTLVTALPVAAEAAVA